MKLNVRFSLDEEYPVASLREDPFKWDPNGWNIEVMPDEWYTAKIYENLRDQAQDYCYSFGERRL